MSALNKRWYLAGPLFNPAQVALLEKIEATFAAAEVPLFSPRLCDENKVKGPITSDSAARIFSRNWEALLKCSGILAVVDWLLPEGQEIRQVRQCGMTNLNPPIGEYTSPSLNIPDAGTVWELGAAYALRSEYGPHGKRGPINPLPILLFTVRPSDQKLNVMLSQGTDGVIYGLSNLGGYLTDDVNSRIESKFVKEWEGGNL